MTDGACLKKEIFICSHTSQIQSTPLLHDVSGCKAVMQSLNLEVISVSFELDIVNHHFIHFNVLFSALHRDAVASLLCVCVCAFVSIHASLKTMTVMT